MLRLDMRAKAADCPQFSIGRCYCKHEQVNFDDIGSLNSFDKTTAVWYSDKLLNPQHFLFVGGDDSRALRNGRP